jgi:predicted PurR-regulated permease PerM
MDFLHSLYPVFRLCLTLLIVLGFIWGLARIIHWKLHELLTSINSVIKLEVSDPIGRICLTGIVLFITLFLVCFVSDEAFKLASSFLPPELVSHSINLNMLAVITSLTFFINLAILAWLKTVRPNKPK